jgi:hypothetical protein
VTDRERLAVAIRALDVAFETGKIEAFVEALEHIVGKTQNTSDGTVDGVFWTACRNAARAGREAILLNKSAIAAAPPRKRLRSHAKRTERKDR